MIDRKDFEMMRKNFSDFDAESDDLQAKSRDIIHLSKKVIYALHRGEKTSLQEMTKKVQALKKQIKKFPELEFSGSFKVAMQEYVEAAAYFYFMQDKKLVPSSKLGVDNEYYLLGVCDLVGELNRKAVNSAIKGDYKMALLIQRFLSDLYAEFLGFDFRNSELRRKFDTMKYEIKKVEDLVLELKLKKKV
jgi:predicted translin family RNA/ssDNA-binding protein